MLPSVRLVFLLALVTPVPVALGICGVDHLKNGIALDNATPVPLALAMSWKVPRAAYLDAADALSRANRRDGSAQLALAEVQIEAHGSSQLARERIKAALIRDPTASEGWTLYADSLAKADPAEAATALAQAISVAPYEGFGVQERVRIGLYIWKDLTAQTRFDLVRQVGMLWQEPLLREQISSIVLMPGGEAIVTSAYSQDPETIREINRWLVTHHRNAS